MLFQSAPINISKIFEIEEKQFSRNSKEQKNKTTKEVIIDLLDQASNILESLEAQITKYKDDEVLYTTYIDLVNIIAQITININKLNL